MNPDSRETIHMGINFVFSLPIVIEQRSKVAFENALLDQGIHTSKTDISEHSKLILIRESPTRLDITVAALGPPPAGQLLIVAPNPARPLDLFIEECEAIVRAFEATWPQPNRQILSSDVTLRDLYETQADHAFKELWEIRLKQPPDSLDPLGRPVLGGGLRFVMPPLQNEVLPVQIEAKIESFLRDTKKIFVESQFTWPAPMPPGTKLDPASRLKQVDEYIENQVLSFILGGSK